MFQSSVKVHPLDSSSFQKREGSDRKDDAPDSAARRQAYSLEGMRQSVHAALLVHHGNEAIHVLLLQQETDDRRHAQFRLPGGSLRPGEALHDGLQRKLNKLLRGADQQHEWEVSEMLGRFYRPEFDDLLYPYRPAHVTRPKEAITMYADQTRDFFPFSLTPKTSYLLQLPDACEFSVQDNETLVAVPLCDLQGREDKYGPVLCMLPALLSRFDVVTV